MDTIASETQQIMSTTDQQSQTRSNQQQQQQQQSTPQRPQNQSPQQPQPQPQQLQQPQQQQQSQQNQSQQQQQPPPPNQPPYSVPGILHYLQYEWHRFEMERQEWEVEKAELAARIALLQGEKKSNDNLRIDLVRRIKMLEYCLRMERAKYYKLKFGTDPPFEDPTSVIEQQMQKLQHQDDEEIKLEEDECSAKSDTNNIAYGRELLRHYLAEIGYTDAVIDLRSSRVRSLLGMVDDVSKGNKQDSPMQANSIPTNNSPASTGFNGRKLNGPTFVQQQLQHRRNRIRGNYMESAKKIDENESAVLATFKFLYQEKGEKGESNNSDDDEDEEDEIPEDAVDAADRAASTSTSGYSYFDKDYSEAFTIKEKRHLLKMPNIDSNFSSAERRYADSKSSNDQSTSTTNWCLDSQKKDPLDIGDLANLTSLDADSIVDYRRKQWTAKFRMQSHFDCVRAMKFVEIEPLIVTASEDQTIKVWHLTRQPQSSGKSRQPNIPVPISTMGMPECGILDLEPIHTYRGHSSAILCIAVHKRNIYSGAKNGELFMWKLIDDPGNVEQYEKFKKSLLACKYDGHSDSIWSIECIELTSCGPILCSAGSDGQIKFWNLEGSQKSALKVITVEPSPTCVASIPLDIIPDSGVTIAVSFQSGKVGLYDVESCLNSSESYTKPSVVYDVYARVNSIVVHPTLPCLVSADSNHVIKFWDLKTHEQTYTMTAHQDEVTSLAIDPTGRYLLSGSHDSSVRLWLFDEKSCIQEITSHRKKYDEGILSVAFHPKLSHFATAGADGSAKYFV